jgi:hypothetical protein
MGKITYRKIKIELFYSVEKTENFVNEFQKVNNVKSREIKIFLLEKLLIFIVIFIIFNPKFYKFKFTVFINQFGG